MTQTLLERLQREARKKLKETSEVINPSLWYVNPKDLDSLIAHTLKEAAMEIGRLEKDDYGCSCYCGDKCGCSIDDFNAALTDAQGVLIGDDNN